MTATQTPAAQPAAEKRTRNTWTDADVKALVKAVENRGDASMQSVFEKIGEKRGVQAQAVRAKYHALNGGGTRKSGGRKAATSPAATLVAAMEALSAAVQAVADENAALNAKLDAIRNI